MEVKYEPAVNGYYICDNDGARVTECYYVDKEDAERLLSSAKALAKAAE